MTKKTKNEISIGLVVIGLILFLFGGAIDLTVIGAPAGLTANVIGVLLILAGVGRKVL